MFHVHLFGFQLPEPNIRCHLKGLADPVRAFAILNRQIDADLGNIGKKDNGIAAGAFP